MARNILTGREIPDDPDTPVAGLFGPGGAFGPRPTQEDADAIFDSFGGLGFDPNSQDIIDAAGGGNVTLRETFEEGPGIGLGGFSPNDPRLDPLSTAGKRLLQLEDREESQAQDTALVTLSGGIDSIDALMESFNKLLKELADPFSDELFESRRQNTNDQILRDILQLQGGVGDSLSSRGIQGGGQASAGNALVQGAGLAARADALTGLQAEQLDVNNQTNLALAGLRSQFGIQGNKLRSNLLGAKAGVEAGNFTRTGDNLAFLESIANADFSLAESEKLIALLEEQGTDPGVVESVINALLQGFTGFAQASGNPNQFILGNILQPVSDSIFDHLGVTNDT